MQRISFFVGDWQGEGWVRRGPGEPTRFRGEEKVEARLDGRLLIIEGVHRAGEPSRIVHHAVATISWNPEAARYDFRSHLAEGGSHDFVGRFEDGAFLWGGETLDGGRMRYVIRINDRRWHEIGEFSRDGGVTWAQFFEMELQRTAP